MNLVLFMTRGMSLAAWERNGSLERELALYAEFARHGWKTGIISWGDEQDKHIAAKYPWLKVCVNRWHLPQQRYEQLLPLLHAKTLLMADIIKSNQSNGADCAYRCARLWQKPFIARCGYIWSQLSADMHRPDVYQAQKIESEVYQNCNIGITTTENGKKYLIDHYDIDSKKIYIIPNYVPDQYFSSPTPNYSNKTKVITQVGRLSIEKNLFSLIEACSELPVTLRLVGDGPLKEKLKKYADQYGTRIEFTGTVPTSDLPHILEQSTIVTLVSHYEGHPKTLIEAMARGCAVLGTKVRGIAPIIKDRSNGLLCDTDSNSIRIGLETLLADKTLRERLGNQARIDAQQFSISNIANKELAIYTKFSIETTRQKVKKAICILYHLVPKIIKKLKNTISCKIDKYILRILVAKIRTYIRHKDSMGALKFLFLLDENIYSLESTYLKENTLNTSKYISELNNFFSNRLQTGEQVLETDCGKGALSYEMAQNSDAYITAIDSDATNIICAHQLFSHPRVKFIQGDPLSYIPAHKFDTVILSNSLEHRSERIKFLHDLQERLTPRRFLLRVPLSERDWRVPLKKELRIDGPSEAHRGTEYTQEQLACELACAGLYITEFQIRWGEIWCEACAEIPYAQTCGRFPLVTVLMSVHNGEKYLETAVNSILRQTLRDFNFLIIDDASTDNSPQMLKEFARKDARIRILTNRTNLGLAASLNRGISQIETRYIARMDADDIAVPQRLERQLQYMESHPEIAAVGSGVGRFSINNNFCFHIYQPACSPNIIKNRSYNIGPQLVHPTVVVRTEALKKVGNYREQFISTQDYDLWLRMLESYELSNLPEILLYYRKEQQGISFQRQSEQSINHILALQSSEYRRKNLLDPLQSNPPHTITVLQNLLDVSQPSFWVWIKLLCTRNIHSRFELLNSALDKFCLEINSEKTLPFSNSELINNILFVKKIILQHFECPPELKKKIISKIEYIENYLS